MKDVADNPPPPRPPDSQQTAAAMLVLHEFKALSAATAADLIVRPMGIGASEERMPRGTNNQL
jgi:hypothetical protein